MKPEIQQVAGGEFLSTRRGRLREVRPLTTDERAFLAILALYLWTFCIAAFAYFESLSLKILGAASATAGMVLFIAAFFNTEDPEHSTSRHPMHSYLFSFFFVLLSLFLLRLVGGWIINPVLSAAVLYSGVVAALIIFRKAMIQVISAMLAIVFLMVTFANREAILAGNMRFNDAVRHCGAAVFQIGPIQDVANMLIAGRYVTYTRRVDYKSEQIQLMAAKKVAHCNDDELLKTLTLLDFVSNRINYVSDPADGLEYAKDPISTLIAGAGDCEDQALLLCSLLEAVGVKTYMVFTPDHVYSLVQFTKAYPELSGKEQVYINGKPCYAIDAADPGAVLGESVSRVGEVGRIFDVQTLRPVRFRIAGMD